MTTVNIFFCIVNYQTAYTDVVTML